MRIGIVSYRIGGNDGVSLIFERWKHILHTLGHEVVLVAGEGSEAVVLPQLHFLRNRAGEIYEDVVIKKNEFGQYEKELESLVNELDGQLEEVFQQYKFDRLVVGNCFSLPMQFSAAPALDRVVKRMKLKTISMNFDYWWDRQRFLDTDEQARNFFENFFVPRDNSYLRHTTINSLARQALKDRLGLESSIVPDTFDFESNINVLDNFNADWRKEMGISENDVVFLQATRIIARKAIERSIDVVYKLNDPRVVLVLAGKSEDEGKEYENWLRFRCRETGIRHVFVGDRVEDSRGVNALDQKIYTLWDCFVRSDWMMFPSEFEGFGNQFVEGVYFKKPIFVNRYSVYRADIEPMGFECVTMDGEVNEQVVSNMRSWLTQPGVVKKAVEKNFEIARQNLSFEATAKRLEELVT